jgi:hypothetical protein
MRLIEHHDSKVLSTRAEGDRPVRISLLRTASEENLGIITKGSGRKQNGPAEDPPARRGRRWGRRPYGRAIVMTGDCQVSTCAGLAESPRALRTLTRTMYWPFGTV